MLGHDFPQHNAEIKNGEIKKAQLEVNQVWEQRITRYNVETKCQLPEPLPQNAKEIERPQHEQGQTHHHQATVNDIWRQKFIDVLMIVDNMQRGVKTKCEDIESKHLESESLWRQKFDKMELDLAQTREACEYQQELMMNAQAQNEHDFAKLQQKHALEINQKNAEHDEALALRDMKIDQLQLEHREAEYHRATADKSWQCKLAKVEEDLKIAHENLEQQHDFFAEADEIWKQKLIETEFHCTETQEFTLMIKELERQKVEADRMWQQEFVEMEEDMEKVSEALVHERTLAARARMENRNQIVELCQTHSDELNRNNQDHAEALAQSRANSEKVQREVHIKSEELECKHAESERVWWQKFNNVEENMAKLKDEFEQQQLVATQTDKLTWVENDLKAACEDLRRQQELCAEADEIWTQKVNETEVRCAVAQELTSMVKVEHEHTMSELHQSHASEISCRDAEISQAKSAHAAAEHRKLEVEKLWQQKFSDAKTDLNTSHEELKYEKGLTLIAEVMGECTATEIRQAYADEMMQCTEASAMRVVEIGQAQRERIEAKRQNVETEKAWRQEFACIEEDLQIARQNVKFEHELFMKARVDEERTMAELQEAHATELHICVSKDARPLAQQESGVDKLHCEAQQKCGKTGQHSDQEIACQDHERELCVKNLDGGWCMIEINKAQTENVLKTVQEELKNERDLVAQIRADHECALAKLENVEAREFSRMVPEQVVAGAQQDAKIDKVGAAPGHQKGQHDHIWEQRFVGVESELSMMHEELIAVRGLAASERNDSERAMAILRETHSDELRREHAERTAIIKQYEAEIELKWHHEHEASKAQHPKTHEDSHKHITELERDREIFEQKYFRGRELVAKLEADWECNTQELCNAHALELANINEQCAAAVPLCDKNREKAEKNQIETKSVTDEELAQDRNIIVTTDDEIVLERVKIMKIRADNERALKTLFKTRSNAITRKENYEIERDETRNQCERLDHHDVQTDKCEQASRQCIEASQEPTDKDGEAKFAMERHCFESEPPMKQMELQKEKSADLKAIFESPKSKITELSEVVKPVERNVSLSPSKESLGMESPSKDSRCKDSPGKERVKPKQHRDLQKLRLSHLLSH